MSYSNPFAYSTSTPYTGIDVATRLRPGPISGIEWTLDGHAIPMNAGQAGLEQWRGSMTSDGGFDQFAGVSVARALPQGSGQDSLLVGYRPSGSVLWSGQLSTDPKLKDGLAILVADGPRREWLNQTGSRFYQSRDYQAWAARDGDPFVDGTGQPAYRNDNAIAIDISGGRILYRIAKGSSVQNSDNAGIGFWVPFAGPITRIAFSYDTSSAQAAQYDIIIRSGIGPAQTVPATLRDSFALGNGVNGGTYDHAWSSDDDLVFLNINRTGATDTNTPDIGWVRIYNLRVNGIAVGDTFLTSDVMTDLAGAVGFDPSGIQSSSQNALPLYWQGGSWTELAAQVAMMDDWRVIVREDLGAGPFVDYGPWGTAAGGRPAAEWIASLERHATEELQQLRRYNRVVQPYQLGSGTPQIVRASAQVDPWGDGRIVEYTADPIADPQPDATLPTVVAQASADLLASVQVRGLVTLGQLHSDQDEHSPARPDELQAGDLITIPDYSPEIGPQRVVGVDYQPGVTTGTVGQDITMAGLISNLENATARRRVVHRRKR